LQDHPDMEIMHPVKNTRKKKRPETISCKMVSKCKVLFTNYHKRKKQKTKTKLFQFEFFLYQIIFW